MLAGGLTGTEFDGEIVDLDVRPTFRGLGFSFAHKDASAAQEWRYLVLLNGETVAVLGSDELEGQLDGLVPGSYRLEVVPISPEVFKLPDLHGHPYGREAYLRWTPSTSTDVRSYKIYHDDQTGTVDYNTVIATVDEISVEERFKAAADSGTGSGRVSVRGEWYGDATNRAFYVKVASGNELKHNLPAGVEVSTGLTIYEGGQFLLPGGVEVVFESPVADYDVGDQWNFQVGPRASWCSDELAAGNWKFGVKAVDSAGNLSGADEFPISIVYAPEPVEDLAAAWDSASNEIDVTWTLPVDASRAAVLVYSNYHPVFGTLEDNIIEDEPLAELGSAVTSYTVASPQDGTWKFRVKTKDSSGRIGEGDRVVEVVMPSLPAGYELAEPQNVQLTPISGGRFTLSWSYDFSLGASCLYFGLYFAAAPSSISFFAPTSLEPVVETEGYREYSVTLGPYSDGTVVSAVVRSGRDGYTSSNTEAVSATADASAPADVTGLKGTAN